MKYGVIFTIILFMSIATCCTQRTCPTYTKGLKDVPQEQVNIKEQRKV